MAIGDRAIIERQFRMLDDRSQWGETKRSLRTAAVGFDCELADDANVKFRARNLAANVSNGAGAVDPVKSASDRSPPLEHLLPNWGAVLV